MPSLTDGAIRQTLKRVDKSRQQISLADGEGRGTGRLVLILKPMPTRVTAEWMAQQWRDGRRTKSKIGSYPAMSLSNAREIFKRDFAGTILKGSSIKRGKRALADHIRSYVRSAFSWGIKAERDYRNTSPRRFKLVHNPAADILLSRRLWAPIKTSFRSDKNKFVEHSFNIFPEIYLERREQPTDSIEAFTVTLARPIIASLEDGHFTCLNHALMQDLGTIGQALVMRLFFHLSNLYDGHHIKRLSLTKRYDGVCNEWLGGLTVLKYPSMIERDPLGPHLRELISAKFLASYNIDRAKNGEGFVISFRPGSAFFDDYDRFYRRRERASAQFDFHGAQRVIAEPLRVAYFGEKRTGQKNAGIPYVPSKDVDRQAAAHSSELRGHARVHRLRARAG